MAVDPIFLDTNVLLAAVVPTRPQHAAAIRVLDGALGRGHVNGQVLREFLVVSTRPVEVNGLGQDPSTAIRNVGSFFAGSGFSRRMPRCRRVCAP